MENVIEINTDQIASPKSSDSLYECRSAMAGIPVPNKTFMAQVTICVKAYNKIEKTKRCVESILKYTNNIDYELLLIDNGSDDGTFEYFQQINFKKKTIIRITKNIGGPFPLYLVSLYNLARYIVLVENDIVVTSNWLFNMIKIAESDQRIGIVTPSANNVSNLQAIDFKYRDYDEMQEIAEQINQSDPTKWHERIRLVTLCTLYKKECLMAVGWPIIDLGFFHDFSDDDIVFRIRRSGYKAILARDVWVCHDHPISDRYNNEIVSASLCNGRKNFFEKYYGIDAWEDVNNYVFYLIEDKLKEVPAENPKILGIDCKCGTPILDIKNLLKRFGRKQMELSAFTQEDKYTMDLNTICNGSVICDREEFISDAFLSDYFDYIILDRPINQYHEPIKVLVDVYSMLHQKGQIFFKLKNSFTIYSFLRVLGYLEMDYTEYCINYPYDIFAKKLSNSGFNIQLINLQYIQGVSEEIVNKVQKILEDNGNNNCQEMMNRLMVDNFWFVIEK